MGMTRSRTYGLVLAAVFTAVTAVLSLVTVPLPFTAVPLSLSLLAVFLCGALLEPKWAATAQLAYLLLGMAGMPAFSGFRGGLSVIAGPTGGFLIAYPLMALAISLTVKRTDKRTFPVLLAGMALALVICYAVGSVWLMVVTGADVGTALTAAVFPFVLPDILKAVAAAVTTRAIECRMKNAE